MVSHASSRAAHIFTSHSRLFFFFLCVFYVCLFLFCFLSATAFSVFLYLSTSSPKCVLRAPPSEEGFLSPSSHRKHLIYLFTLTRAIKGGGEKARIKSGNQKKRMPQSSSFLVSMAILRCISLAGKADKRFVQLSHLLGEGERTTQRRPLSAFEAI